MATPIITELPHVEKRPRKPRRERQYYCNDPIRALSAAVVLRAVDDLLFPNSQTPVYARHTAATFLHSDIGQDMLRILLGKMA